MPRTLLHLWVLIASAAALGVGTVASPGGGPLWGEHSDGGQGWDALDHAPFTAVVTPPGAAPVASGERGGAPDAPAHPASLARTVPLRPGRGAGGRSRSVAAPRGMSGADRCRRMCVFRL